MPKHLRSLVRLIFLTIAFLYPIFYLLVRGLPGLLPESLRVDNEIYGFALIGCEILILVFYLLILRRDRRIYHFPAVVLIPLSVLSILPSTYLFDRFDIHIVEQSQGNDHWLFSGILATFALLLAWLDFALWMKEKKRSI